MAKSLDEIAREAHDRHENEINAKGKESQIQEEPKKEESSSESSGTVFTDDDDLETEETKNIVKETEETQKAEISKEDSVKMITKDDIASFMPDIDVTVRNQRADMLMKKMQDYQKHLIIDEGFTPEEAAKAVRSRSMKDAKKENDAWLDTHPHTGIVTIKKGDEDKLALTPEEHEKLVTTNVIELHLVTSEELKHTKIADIPTSGSKLDYIRTLNSMAVRSVAMPAMGDIATFRSATSAEIIRSGITLEARTSLESIDKLSTFLYDHFVNCHTFSKYDDTNAISLTYDDFCNKFPFFEIPMAEYAIYAASSPESINVDLTCNRCHKNFKWDMNPNKILDVNGFDEKAKKEFDLLNAHFNDVEWLSKHSDEKMQATIMESPISKNRFVIQTPSISRAKQVMQAAENLHLYDAEDGSDEADLNTTIIACALMLNKLYIYSAKDDGYIEFKSEEIEDILRVLPSIPNDDFRMINKFSVDCFYTPTFSSGTIKCPSCNQDIEFSPSADQLLFLYAREEFRIQ